MQSYSNKSKISNEEYNIHHAQPPTNTNISSTEKERSAFTPWKNLCLFHHDYNIWDSPEYTFTAITAQFLVFFT